MTSQNFLAKADEQNFAIGKLEWIVCDFGVPRQLVSCTETRKRKKSKGERV